MNLEGTIATVTMAGVGGFLAISLFKSIKNPSQRWRAITYLVTFTTCIVILEQIMRTKLAAEGISSKASCSPSSVLLGAEPAYAICNGFFVPTALGAEAYKGVSALRSIALAFTASGAATQIILLKLKWQLAKAAPSGEFPIIMAFIAAALSFLTLYHAPEILDAANRWIGNASGTMTGMGGFFNWLGHEHSIATATVSNAPWTTAAMYVSVLKVGIIWMIFGTYMLLGVFNFVIFLAQSVGIVLLPLVFCLLFLLGSASWESNLKVIGLLALLGCVGPAQNYAIDLAVGSPEYSVAEQHFRGRDATFRSPQSTVLAPTMSSDNLEGLANVDYDESSGFSPSSLGAFLWKALLALLVAIGVVVVTGFAMFFGVFTFAAKLATSALAQSLGANRQADWMAGVFSNGRGK